jgi:hypothetical protein
MDEIPTICDHNFTAFHNYYHVHMDKVKSNLCSDPLKIHQTDEKPNAKCPKGTNKVSLNMCDSLKKQNVSLSIFPGQKVCVFCNSRLTSLMKNPKPIPSSSTTSLKDFETMLNDDDEVFVSPLHGLKIANEAAQILGLTPIKIETKESKAKRALKIARKSE